MGKSFYNRNEIKSCVDDILSKCQFAATEVSFLGHTVSQKGISPDKNKVVAVKQILASACVKDVRSFLGLAGYYRRFIPAFSTAAAPLTRLTTKKEGTKPFKVKYTPTLMLYLVL